MYNLSGLGELLEGGTLVKRFVTAAALAAVLVLPAAPAGAGEGPIVRTEQCPPGMVGRTIHIGDNTSVYNCYRLP